MIKYRVLITGDAQNDFKSIRNFLISNGMSSKQALQEVINLVKQIKKLDIFPKRYDTISRRYGIAISDSYRAMPVNNYVAFYKIDEGKHSVYVKQIKNQKENIIDYLLH